MIVFVAEIRRKWSRENRDERSRRRNVGKKVEMQSTSPRRQNLGRDVVNNVAVSGREEVGDDKQGRQSSRGLAVWGVGTTMGRVIQNQ